ncbi:MAG: hypothetical protein WBO36_16790 [Saprospiraceae bacterium]
MVYIKSFFGWMLLIAFSCQSQSKDHTSLPAKDATLIKRVGGSFENSEFIYDKMQKNIPSVDISGAWDEHGQKLIITGKVYKIDGRTPAANVVLYYYHTNGEGKYKHKPEIERSMPPNHLGQTHGYIRGWVKTDSTGSYSIHTLRPGVYPSRDTPAHIHVTVKEPNEINEYYIDDLVFDDDQLLTGDVRKKLENRGGSGVLRILLSDDTQIAEHNIVLGLNIPDYPVEKSMSLASGLSIGEDQPSFMPYHVYGPDKGSRTCPVCKYGRYHGIIYFAGANPDWGEIKSWLRYMEQESKSRKTYLKAYLVCSGEKGKDLSTIKNKLTQLGKELYIIRTALTVVPSINDIDSEMYLNEINPKVKNTIIVYRHRNIIDKYINLDPTDANFAKLSKVLDQSKGDYFHLAVPEHD